MGIGSVAGAKLYIADPGPLSPAPSWVEVKNIFNIGEFAKNFADVVFESVGDAVTRHRKGTMDMPPIPITLNTDYNDQGQADLRAASDETPNAIADFFNFRLVVNDAQGSPSKATTYIWKGQVGTFSDQFGGVNDPRRSVSSIIIEPDTVDFEPNGGGVS